MIEPGAGPRKYAPYLIGLAVGIAAGAVFARLRVPLPWMLGPLFTIAALRMAGADIRAIRFGREMGQWILGTTLALYFTPAAVGIVARLAPVLALAVVVAIAMSYLSGTIVSRIGRIDFPSAFFGAVPGGATEMAILAQRHGGRVDQVAAAQSMRIMLVVATIPALYQWFDLQGVDRYPQAATEFSPTRLAALMGATFAGAFLFRKLRVRNAWIIGPLCVAIPLATSGLAGTSMPRELSNAAQLLLGTALGVRFIPEFLREAPRFLAAVLLSTYIAMSISALFALAMVGFTGLHWTTLILSTAPGGMAEMSLTAKVLEIGTPIVTSFHVTRMAMLVLVTEPLYRWMRRK